jgi:hypothetical protein
MRFGKWFRRKPVVTFRAEIVVSPKKPPDPELTEFSVEDVEGIVNLWPFASDVLVEYGRPVPFTADSLARLAVKAYFGGYIKVAEYPTGIERDLAKQMIHRTIRRAKWIGDFSRKMRVVDSFPTCELRPGKICCDRARALSKAPVRTETLERLPMDGCWERDCQCWWHQVSRFKQKT